MKMKSLFSSLDKDAHIQTKIRSCSFDNEPFMAQLIIVAKIKWSSNGVLIMNGCLSHFRWIFRLSLNFYCTGFIIQDNVIQCIPISLLTTSQTLVWTAAQTHKNWIFEPIFHVLNEFWWEFSFYNQSQDTQKLNFAHISNQNTILPFQSNYNPANQRKTGTEE